MTVSGAGDAEDVVISDVLPAELEYVPNSLQVAGVAEDDDFAPSGVDNSGFNSGTATVVVDQGVISGGSPVLVITFEASVR